MTEIYQEKLIGAPDVCSNCLGIRLVDQLQPTRAGMNHELESAYSRHKRNTDLDHHPGDEPTDDRHLFCECGVASARVRVWDTVDREKFRTLLKRAVKTAESKGVTLNQKRAFGHALETYDDTGDVDDAIETGLKHGSVATINA